MTTQQQLKTEALKCANELLDAYETDIETGIDDGTYSAKDNKETRKFIAQCKDIFKKLESYTPAVYVYVEGGNIQGASGTEQIEFFLFDKDNFDAADEQERNLMGTPDEWDIMIKEKEAKKLIQTIH